MVLFIVGSVLLCFPNNEKAFFAGIFLVGVPANCIYSMNLTGRDKKIFITHKVSRGKSSIFLNLNSNALRG